MIRADESKFEGYDFSKIVYFDRRYLDRSPGEHYLNTKEYIRVINEEKAKGRHSHNPDWQVFLDEEIARAEKSEHLNRVDLFSETLVSQNGPHNFEILNCKEINDLLTDTEEWRISNLVPAKGITILAGISGEGKSWIAYHFADCISKGAKVFGVFPTIKSKVLYIDAENPISVIKKRTRQLQMHDNEDVCFHITNDLNLNSEENVQELIDLIDSEKFETVIIDTFIAVSPGVKTEKAEDIREFMKRFQSLKHKNTVIFLDHQRKPARHEGKEPKKEFLFGSQDKSGNAESILMLMKNGNEITIFQRKNRYGIEAKPFVVEMKDEDKDKVHTIKIAYVGDLRDKENKVETAKLHIIGILQDRPLTTPEIIEIMSNDKDVGEKNTREAIKQMTKEKIICKDGKEGRADVFCLPKNITPKVDENLPI